MNDYHCPQCSFISATEMGLARHLHTHDQVHASRWGSGSLQRYSDSLRRLRERDGVAEPTQHEVDEAHEIIRQILNPNK